MHPNSVHITAVLVEYKTRTGRTNQGVATSWFKKLKVQMDTGRGDIVYPPVTMAAIRDLLCELQRELLCLVGH